MNRHIKLIEQFEDETELPATWSTGGMGGYTDEYTEWLQEKVATIDNLQTSDKQNDRSQHVSGSLHLYEIDFGGVCMAGLEIEDNNINVKGAVNGGGHSIDAHKIKVTKRQ